VTLVADDVDALQHSLGVERRLRRGERIGGFGGRLSLNVSESVGFDAESNYLGKHLHASLHLPSTICPDDERTEESKCEPVERLKTGSGSIKTYFSGSDSSTQRKKFSGEEVLRGNKTAPAQFTKHKYDLRRSGHDRMRSFANGRGAESTARLSSFRCALAI